MEGGVRVGFLPAEATVRELMRKYTSERSLSGRLLLIQHWVQPIYYFTNRLVKYSSPPERSEPLREPPSPTPPTPQSRTQWVTGGSFPLIKWRRGGSNHSFHLMSRLRICGDIPPPTLHNLTALSETILLSPRTRCWSCQPICNIWM